MWRSACSLVVATARTLRHARRSEQRLHELLGSVSAVVAEFDVEKRCFTYVSGATEVVTGYPPDAFFADPRFWSDRIHPEDRRRVFDLYDEATRTGDDYEFEYRFRSSDDSIRWMRGSAQVVKDGSGRPASIRTVTIDVTETRRAITAAERSRSLLAATLDATADGIVVVGQGGEVTAANRRFAEMWQLPPELVEAGDSRALLDEIALRLPNPEGVTTRVQEWYAAPKRETFDVIEFPDGRVFELYSAPQRLDDRIVGRVLSFHDVSERRRAEAAERATAQRFRETLENVSLIAVGIDAQGILTYANHFFLQLTGWERDEVVGRDWFDRFDDDEAVKADYFDCIARGMIRPNFESAIRTRAGETRAIRWSSTLERDESGTVTGIITIGEDITERLRAHEALQEREEHFRSLIEQATDVISVLTPDGTSLYESPSVERVLGWTPEELMGSQNLSLQHPDDRGRTSAALAAILAGEEVPPIELRLRHKNGGWRTVESVGRRRQQNGEPVLVLNYRDITERKELEEQLLHAQKLEAVGLLAGGIAHDFNNLLTAIGGYSEFLLASFDADDPRRRDAAEIARAAERAAALTNQLLAFSRRQVLQPEVLDVGAVVGDLENLFSRLLGVDIDLTTTAGSGCYVEADRGQLEQVLTNLAVNARDAMPRGGRLSIDCRRIEDGEAPMVELSVADTGVGMDAETLSHVFDPFFTTKEKDKGTGLGLATVYGIVAQSGGEVTVASELGAGATFRVLLPAAACHEREDPEREPEIAVDQPADETILLVEDEETIRRLVAEVLSRSGYTVLDAPAADAALEVMREHGSRIDLLLTDVVMPGMSGPDLARVATVERPSLRVLFTSGYTNEPDELLSDPGAAFIGKPFSPQALVAKVREVLASG